MPKKRNIQTDLTECLNSQESQALENDLKHFGYLLPTNDDELEEFEKIFGTTQVMLPDHFKDIDSLFEKKLTDSHKLISVKKELIQPKKIVAKKALVKSFKANNYFKKLVLSAEIASQLYNEPTFGHIKFVKIRYLCEEVCNMQLGSTYGKFAAGPLDPKVMYSTDREFINRKWFSVTKTNYGYKYQPLENVNSYKDYYLKYFSEKADRINSIIELFKKERSDFCEIVATLFAVWKDSLNKKESISDLHLFKAFYAWSKEKKRFKDSELTNAITWMKDNNIVPII